MRRRISMLGLVLGLLFLALTGASCDQRGRHRAVDRNTLTVQYIGDERILFQDYWGMEASYLVFLPLVAPEGDEYGELQPVLAQRWEHSDDYREWTFYLRKDVNWHDGVPVTAHDIKFTLDLRQNPAHPGRMPARHSVEVLDDHTLRVRYPQPTDGLDGWSVYYPRHLLRDLDPAEFFEWDFWTHPVGNGPYRFVRQIPQTMIEVEANPDYYRGPPAIQRVILRFSPEPALAELLSGNVDALTYAGRDLLLHLGDDERFQPYHWWGSWMETIHWNHSSPLFERPSVRRALTLAIDRRELARVLNYPDSVPIFDVVSSTRQRKRQTLPEPLPFDGELAVRLLEEAGWRDIDSDGVREKDGTEFRFTLLVEAGAMNNAAVFLQDQLRRVGVRMEIQSLDGNLTNARLTEGDFEAVLSRFMNHGVHPRGHVWLLGDESPLGYRNPEMARLVRMAADAIDLDERDRIYGEIMPIFMEDHPVTFLLPQVQTHVVHQRIRGLSSNIRPDPVWFAEYLWIEGN